MNRYLFSFGKINPRNPKAYVLMEFIEAYKAKASSSFDFHKNDSHRFPEIVNVLYQKLMEHKGQYSRLKGCDVLLNTFLTFEDDGVMVRMATVGGMTFTPGPGGYYETFVIPYEAFL